MKAALFTERLVPGLFFLLICLPNLCVPRKVTDHSFVLQEKLYTDATALATAAWNGQVEKVKKLIKEGADVSERGLSQQKGFTPESPLQLAIDKVGHSCEGSRAATSAEA